MTIFPSFREGKIITNAEDLQIEVTALQRITNSGH